MKKPQPQVLRSINKQGADVLAADVGIGFGEDGVVVVLVLDQTGGHGGQPDVIFCLNGGVSCGCGDGQPLPFIGPKLVFEKPRPWSPQSIDGRWQPCSKCMACLRQKESQ